MSSWSRLDNVSNESLPRMGSWYFCLNIIRFASCTLNTLNSITVELVFVHFPQQWMKCLRWGSLQNPCIYLVLQAERPNRITLCRGQWPLTASDHGRRRYDGRSPWDRKRSHSRIGSHSTARAPQELCPFCPRTVADGPVTLRQASPLKGFSPSQRCCCTTYQASSSRTLRGHIHTTSIPYQKFKMIL